MSQTNAMTEKIIRVIVVLLEEFIFYILNFGCKCRLILICSGLILGFRTSFGMHYLLYGKVSLGIRRSTSLIIICYYKST